MGRTIAVISGKGGVGKTTACLNIAVALSNMGKNVLLCDCDFGLRNLDMMLGVSDAVVYHIADCAMGNCSKDKAIIKIPKYERISFLAAPQQYKPFSVTKAMMKRLISDLRDDYDFIFLDSPAGIGEGFGLAVACANEAIVLATPDSCSVRDADKAVEAAIDEGITDIRFIANRVIPEHMKKGLCLSIDDMIDSLSLGLIGIVPDDTSVIKCLSRSQPLTSNTPAGVAFTNIAKRLCGNNIPVMKLKNMRA